MMRNGLLYTITDWTFEKLKYLNLVEYFKWTAKRIYSTDSLLASRAGVDFFIIFKWAAVIALWFCQVNSGLVNLFIWYLIGTNLFTYFYYHIWTKDLVEGHFNLDRVKRRFLNLMLAISFNILCFAYLFVLPFSRNYQWTGQVSKTKDALFFSIANSLTVDYSPVQAITQTGQTLIVLETITTFVFLTIILSNSIPQIKND